MIQQDWSRFVDENMISHWVMLLGTMLLASVQGSTHWVVTEEGKVQEKLESPFAINQPHDLMAFMKQEVNYEKMQKIKDVLVVEKKLIEDNEDKEFNLEEKHYSSDKDCTAAGKHLGEFNLYASTVLPLETKDIEVLDYVHLDDEELGGDDPDCGDIENLPPGSIIYDSLEGVVNREYLTLYQAEPVLKSTLKYVGSEKEFAHAVSAALKQNSSSWVAYNLASTYWRVKGDAEKAIECLRRAIHHSPPAFLDVSLVGLANILHRSRYTINASVVLESALEISGLSVIHFSLGCVYATLGEYSISAEHFEKSLNDQPDFKAANERLHAVKCQNKLQKKLEAQHESLQRTLKELEAYQQKHKKYVEYYHTVEKMQLSQKEQIDLHFLLMQHNIIEGTFDQKLCKLRSDDDGGPVMFCNLPKPNLDESEEDDELIPNIVSGKRKRKLAEKNHEDGQGIEVTRFAAGGASVYVNKHLSEIAMADWKEPNWPTMQACEKDCPQVLPWDQYPSSYIDPESRGFSVTEQLTTYIGLKKGETSPQPWNDLNCEYLEPFAENTLLDTLPGIRDRHAGPMHKPDELLKKEILMHLTEGSIWPGDIAHRINVAIKKSLAEQDKKNNLWFLYNVAGLYFRITGDNLKAVECIRRSVSRIPSQHLDIALVNAGNILYRLGRIDDAARLASASLLLNNDEPATHLAFGNVLQAQGNITGAVAHYEYGLYLKPDSNEIFYALYNVKCGVLVDKKIKEKVLGKGFEIKLTQINEDESGTIETQEFTQVFTTSRVTQVTRTDCENSSDESDLVRRLETTKEDADKILNDADAVIKKLSYVAEDGTEELSSSARKIILQLSQMRDNLGSLMKEATSTIDSAVLMKKVATVKETFTMEECNDVLSNVNIKSYITSNLDVNSRGFDFAEELSSAKNTKGRKEPYCQCADSSDGYNLDTIVNRDSFINYQGEFGMETLLKRLVPSNVDDLTDIANLLADGLQQHPTSWRISYTASYYWRFKGKAREAIDCLRLTLSTSPFEMRDIVLLGLANIFAQLEQWNDADYTIREAIALRPDDFLYHFTLANIIAAKGDTKLSIPLFKRALDLQPDLAIAQARYQAAVCEIQQTGV